MKDRPMRLWFSLWVLLCCVGVWTARPALAQDSKLPAYAFKNVTLHHADGNITENATIVWRDGVIEAAGKGVRIPFDAYVRDGGDSLHVYPGFIDGLAYWGTPDDKKDYDSPERPGEPPYDRAGIQPQRLPNEISNLSDEQFAKAQEHGFTAAALGLDGRMLPGQMDFYFINGKSTADYLYQKGLGLQMQLVSAPGGWNSSAYPMTTMGVMANLRQLYYDATALHDHMTYYASNKNEMPPYQHNDVLEALIPSIQKEQTVYFKADDADDIQRAFWLQDDLGFEMVLVSGKEAYKKVDELKARSIPVLASFDLPKKPDWKKDESSDEENDNQEDSDQEMVEEVSDEEQAFREKQWQAWEEEVQNIKKLMDAGVTVGYASTGLELKDWKKNLETLMEYGMTEADLLNIMSENTAQILGVNQTVGKLKGGHIASFSVYTNSFSDEKAKVAYSIAQGNLTEFDAATNSK
jgi:imidazolonepropionase-like amidohydrolase